MRDFLKCEQAEFQKVWEGLRAKRWPLHEKPNASLKRLLAIDGTATGAASSSMDIRNFHDMLGWMAKNKANCRGAIYRSTKFLAIQPSERNGARPKKDGPPSDNFVHIEHTVPAGELFKAWVALEDRPQSAEGRLHWLLRNSITTALSRAETAFIVSGQHKHNPHYRLDDETCLPFKRYDRLREAGGGIINILSGEEVDPEKWTLGDHRDCVMQLIAN